MGRAKDADIRFEGLLAQALSSWSDVVAEREQIAAALRGREDFRQARKQCLGGASDRVVLNLLGRAMREYLHERMASQPCP